MLQDCFLKCKVNIKLFQKIRIDDCCFRFVQKNAVLRGFFSPNPGKKTTQKMFGSKAPKDEIQVDSQQVQLWSW